MSKSTDQHTEFVNTIAARDARIAELEYAIAYAESSLTKGAIKAARDYLRKVMGIRRGR